MIRSKVLGIGTYVPDRVVTNEEIPYLNQKKERCAEVQTETSDEWIRTRTGIVERRYVPADGSVACSDLGVEAARRALEDAGAAASEVDCIIFATLSPDIHFPGNAVFLQQQLGIAGENGCACYDIRQQCSGFVYGLQMADALLKAGMYRRVLLVGGELHSHGIEFSTRGRDVMVLFGDGAGALLLGPTETDDPREGVQYTYVGANGNGAWDLYAKIFEITKSPLIQYNALDSEDNQTLWPQMDGKRVYLNAVRGMVLATRKALEDTGLTWDDIDWFVPHQANLRINQKVAEVAEIPIEKCLSSIELYGNTTAATVPLTIDHWLKKGKVKKGDRILSTVFGSGYTWGSAIFTL
jgi:3-oxoacyl-[acyl-carrier-protein] synthase III